MFIVGYVIKPLQNLCVISCQNLDICAKSFESLTDILLISGFFCIVNCIVAPG